MIKSWVVDKINIYNVSDIGDTLAACIYMMGIYEEKNPEYAILFINGFFGNHQLGFFCYVHIIRKSHTLAACIYMMGIYEEKNPEYAAMQEDIANEVPIEDIFLHRKSSNPTITDYCFPFYII